MNNKSPFAQRLSGWSSLLARVSMGLLLFEVISGLAITFLPFGGVVQWNVLGHTVIGAAGLLPVAWYCLAHWWRYRGYSMSHVVLLGYVALIGLFLCSLSGVVITWQAMFGLRTSSAWRSLHLISTFVFLAGLVPHLAIVFVRAWNSPARKPAWSYIRQTCGAALVLLLFTGVLSRFYSGIEYVNRLPDDYHFLYGTNRPFAPSLAQTDTGGAFDARSLAGSDSCGTAGCHEQIVQEWQPSAHRYAAMDPVFQGIQNVMAEQNGAESTRYCGGCHDPISLFSGTKNLFVEKLTTGHGYQEGVSCLSCHAIRETDIEGNANYTVTQPATYLWQWQTHGLGKTARDFLIRSIPEEHNRLSKRMYKKPEYCAACHKQFIDEEINRVGWVQLQNQYDNWKASHWRVPGKPTQTVECRECHMPLVASTDPAAGDPADYNRSPDDGKHRSHRFVASNQLIPQMLELEGWKEQTRLTEQWLKGELEVPEIRDKWAEGPIVKMNLITPETVRAGENFTLQVVLSSNKVGHDYPTGPLDLIQSWLEVRVTDGDGREIFTSGRRDDEHFIEPGSFLFKAEPVDQYGNLIDRHNLWEMVGVRYRRALFPGYSDSVSFQIPCPSNLAAAPIPDGPEQPTDASEWTVAAPDQSGSCQIEVRLLYRKVDQFLLNYLFDEKRGITAPVTEINRATTHIKVVSNDPAQ